MCESIKSYDFNFYAENLYGNSLFQWLPVLQKAQEK